MGKILFIVRFCGGLGNQMFQVAFLKSLEVKYPKQIVLADLSAYEKNDFHYGYELERVFGIKLLKAADKDIYRLSHYTPGKYGKWTYRIMNAISKLVTVKRHGYDSRKIKGTEYVEEILSETSVNEIWRITNEDAYFDGFWQNSLFFAPIRDNIFRLFRFNTRDYQECSEAIEQVRNTKSVSVHVRRGDYVGTEFDCLPKDYYERAITYFRESISDVRFFFFSDDIAYVSERFSDLPNKTIITTNTGRNSYRDLLLMTCCENHIIANSSFSYWGAMLGENTNGKVIAPKAFLEGKPSLAESEWIKI